MHSAYKAVEIFLLVAPNENSSPDLLIDALINLRFVKASQAANGPSLSLINSARGNKKEHRQTTNTCAIDIQGRRIDRLTSESSINRHLRNDLLGSDRT